MCFRSASSLDRPKISWSNLLPIQRSMQLGHLWYVMTERKHHSSHLQSQIKKSNDRRHLARFTFSSQSFEFWFRLPHLQHGQRAVESAVPSEITANRIHEPTSAFIHVLRVTTRTQLSIPLICDVVESTFFATLWQGNCTPTRAIDEQAVQPLVVSRSLSSRLFHLSTQLATLLMSRHDIHAW